MIFFSIIQFSGQLSSHAPFSISLHFQRRYFMSGGKRTRSATWNSHRQYSRSSLQREIFLYRPYTFCFLKEKEFLGNFQLFSSMYEARRSCCMQYIHWTVWFLALESMKIYVLCFEDVDKISVIVKMDQIWQVNDNDFSVNSEKVVFL